MALGLLLALAACTVPGVGVSGDSLTPAQMVSPSDNKREAQHAVTRMASGGTPQPHRQTGIITARTEHQLEGEPHFVYDTIYTDGYAWNTITADGKYVPQFAAVALKGVLGLWALWETPYTRLLFDTIVDLYDPQKGFYEGLYENGRGVINIFTANNNGIMLETLLYKVQGKLLRFGTRAGLPEQTREEEFKNSVRCLPRTSSKQ